MVHFVRTAVLITLLMGLVYTLCPNNCISCQGSKCSICDKKYYLSGDSCYLCPDNCLSCVNSSYCNTCISHKWGNDTSLCVIDCDNRCLDRECHDDTGYCVKCEPGKFGRKCQHSCDLCRNKMCDLYKCTEGCKSGYYAFQTESDYICQKCPNNCEECVDGKICRRCNDGFYLHKYSLVSNNVYVQCYQCPTGKECSSFCSIYGCNQCQLNSNKLLCADCPKGEIFNGTACVQNTTLCSHGCSTNCDSNGICLGNCTDGWSGDKCLYKCNDNCIECSKEDRDICLRCKGDYYTANCKKSCNPSCVKELGNQTCSINDGFCLNGCKQGFWDKSCDKSCSVGCVNPVCDRNSGNCMSICKDGYVGEMCVKNSRNEETTSETSPSTSSTIQSPSTLSAIQRGKDKDNNFIIGLFSGIGISVAIVLIVAMAYLLRRRYVIYKEQRGDSHNDNSQTYQNTGIDFQAMEVETENFPNNYESLRTNRQKDDDYSDLRPTRK